MAKEKEMDQKKFLNTGYTQSLSIGTLVFKDLPLEALFDILEILPQVLESLQGVDKEGESDMSKLVKVLKSPEAKQAFFTLIHHSTGESIEVIKKLNLFDALKCFVALKRVIDFKELKEVFMELGLEKLAGLGEKAEA